MSSDSLSGVEEDLSAPVRKESLISQPNSPLMMTHTPEQ